MGKVGENIGNAALKAVCWPVYGTVDTIVKGAKGDGWGAFESGAETLCPIAIGSTVNATKNFIEGDIPEAVEETLETVFPGGLFDPISTGLSEATGEGGKALTEWIMGNEDENPPETKEEDPKVEVEDKEEEKEDARDITNQQANTARKAAYQAAINAGVTPAQAQAAADAQTPVGNYAGNYAALSGAGANARAAYRERQGYADALDRETKNLEEARTREILAAALSGTAGGAGAGVSLF